jgi:broad specificity polyphosphatase/5'/3'-nucleotidase SurE
LVSPSDGAQLGLVDAFITQLKSVLSGVNYSKALSLCVR